MSDIAGCKPHHWCDSEMTCGFLSHFCKASLGRFRSLKNCGDAQMLRMSRVVHECVARTLEASSMSWKVKTTPDTRQEKRTKHIAADSVVLRARPAAGVRSSVSRCDFRGERQLTVPSQQRLTVHECSLRMVSQGNEPLQLSPRDLLFSLTAWSDRSLPLAFHPP
nr:hypothetical protein CFP56_37074 [Quercus suber]